MQVYAPDLPNKPAAFGLPLATHPLLPPGLEPEEEWVTPEQTLCEDVEMAEDWEPEDIVMEWVDVQEVRVEVGAINLNLFW